ncbi:MAG: hypothetical protein ACREP7_16530 [Lysobacter sp.]
MNEVLVSVAPHLAMMLPSMALYALGLALCLNRRKSLGRASTYASLGFAFLLFNSLLNIGSQTWFMWRMMNGHAPASELSISMSISAVVSTLFSLTGLTLLLAAILVRRPAQDA